MDIGLARTFLEVARGGSFVTAAARMFITQSTVSTRIRHLEQELGQALFVRGKSGVVLTPAGERFRRHAVALLRVWEEARQDAALPGDGRITLSIGGQINLWDQLLRRWLVWMRAEAPAIAVRAERHSSATLLGQLDNGQLDLGVLYAPPSRRNLAVERLADDELVLVRTPGSGAVAERDYVYVDWGESFQAFHALHFPDLSQPYLRVDLGSAALRYLLDAGGAAFVSGAAAARYLKTGALESVAGAPTFTLSAYVVYAPDTDNGVLDTAIRGLRQVAKPRARIRQANPRAAA